MRRYALTPKGAYIAHKARAKYRGIAWEFTFETWWKVWQDSGKWEQRGLNKGQYVMCRHKDVGPYSPQNVRIDTTENNIREWIYDTKCVKA